MGRIRIIDHGSLFHVEAGTTNNTVTAMTRAGRARMWRTLDAGTEGFIIQR